MAIKSFLFIYQTVRQCTYLHQGFPAIFNNSFEPQSLNYDPDFYYSPKTFLPLFAFVLTSLLHSMK